MIHYMIDIETLGKGPNAMVLSIAAVKFDHNEVIKAVEIYPDLDEQQQNYHQIDIDTLLWWMKSKEILSEYLSKHRKNLNFCYHQLAFFLFDRTAETKIWSKSPRFDLQILENLWNNHPHLWDYRSQGDVRMAEFKLQQRNIELKKSDKAHDSLSDCFAQVINVQEFLRI